MGRNIYFSEKEILALIETSTEWIDMMMNGNISAKHEADDRLTKA